MSDNEEFLEENSSGDLAQVDQSVLENAMIGQESATPDTTILSDLNDLTNLTFGTRWSQDESPRRDRSRSFTKRRFTPDRRRNFNPENCPHPTFSNQEGSSDFKEDRKNEGHDSQERRFSPQFNSKYRQHRIFFPPFDVQFYQEEKSFNLLLEEMRKNCKTYELFTVAKLILQKPERFVATIRRKPNREGTVDPLYLSLLDDLVFESEHEAMAYIMQHHIEEFFDVKEESVEPPKGRFTCVHRCGITKKLLSAPNYHKYRAILRDHFNAQIYSMSFERFIAKIETTKDENDIQNWIQQMGRKMTYTPKIIDDSISDLMSIDSLDGIKNYLLKYFKDRIIREIGTVRIAGTYCESGPSKPIARAIQFFLERQRHFPLDTANNLRNRFRRVGFAIYRKGKNGISYVCASKRKFRRETDVFEPNIQALFSFLEPLKKITFETVKKDYIDTHSLSEKDVFESLNWLIREGYIVEYENGVLFLNPKLASFRNFEGMEDNSQKPVYQLGMMETSIEKFSDGTLTIAPETTLAIPNDTNILEKIETFSSENTIQSKNLEVHEKKDESVESNKEN